MVQPFQKKSDGFFPFDGMYLLQIISCLTNYKGKRRKCQGCLHFCAKKNGILPQKGGHLHCRCPFVLFLFVRTAICTACRICCFFMFADQNIIQRTIIFACAVMFAGIDCASDAEIAVFHNISLRFRRNRMRGNGIFMCGIICSCKKSLFLDRKIFPLFSARL